MPEIIVKLGDEVVGKYLFDKDVVSIGRARDNDIVIENLSVSRNHARIRRADDKYVLTDLNSANGVFVNGVRVTKTEVLNSDVITIGKHKVIFQEQAPVSREEEISEAFGADRTMLVDRTPTAVLIVIKGKQKDQTFELSKYECGIGRAAENDCVLSDWFVSKKHAMLVREGQNFFIKDLGSWRRTMLNGKYVTESQLKDGDILQFGTTQVRFTTKKEGDAAPAPGRQPKELAMDESFAPFVAAAEGGSPEPVTSAAPLAASQAVDAGPVAGATKKAGDEKELDRFSHLQTRAIEPGDASLEPQAEEQSSFDDLKTVLEVSPEMLAREAERERRKKKKGKDDKQKEIKTPVEAAAPEAPEEKVAAAEAIVAQSAPPEPAPAPEPQPPAKPAAPPAGANEKEIAMWESALQNPSPVIRKQAAKMLTKLTGKHYDY